MYTLDTPRRVTSPVFFFIARFPLEYFDGDRVKRYSEIYNFLGDKQNIMSKLPKIDLLHPFLLLL